MRKTMTVNELFAFFNKKKKIDEAIRELTQEHFDIMLSDRWDNMVMGHSWLSDNSEYMFSGMTVMKGDEYTFMDVMIPLSSIVQKMELMEV
jgi:hypothetical protein